MDKRIMAAILMLLIFSLALQAQTTWDPPKRLTWDNSSTIDPQIAAFWKFVHVCWWQQGGSGNGLFYKRSTDYGETWSPPNRMTYYSIGLPPLAMAVQGPKVHIVYDHLGEIFYRRSIDNGKSWEQPKRLTWGGCSPFMLDIGVSGDYVHIAFSSFGWVDYPDLFYKRSTNNGETWENTQRITWNQGITDYLSLSVAGENVHVAYTEDSLYFEHWDLFYRKSTDNGETWITRSQIGERKQYKEIVGYDDPNSLWYISTAAFNDNAYIFYLGEWQAGILSRISRDNGETWDLKNPVVQPEYPDFLWFQTGLSPRASVAFQNSAFLVCRLWNNTGNEDIFFLRSTDQGMSWTAPERITWFKSLVADPKISYTPVSGYLHMITARKNAAGWALIYKRGVQ